MDLAAGSRAVMRKLRTWPALTSSVPPESDEDLPDVGEDELEGPPVFHLVLSMELKADRSTLAGTA